RQGFECAGEDAGLICHLGTPEADALHGHRHGAPPRSVMRPLSLSPTAPGRRLPEGPVPLSRLSLRGQRATCPLATGRGLLRRGGRNLLARAALCGQKVVRVMREGAP